MEPAISDTRAARRNASRTVALELASLRHSIGDRVLFDGLDLTLLAGESAAIMGPSGSGKSTLLSCALGLVKADGAVRVAGTDIGRLSGRRLAEHRRTTVGVVFQFGELLPELSPVENVALAALLSGTSRRTAYAEAAALLGELGVPVADTPTSSLSGGERQRTAVARALINSPSLLLADEPTGALDEANRESVADMLFSLPEQRGCALLVVTHDPQVAARADRTWTLSGGVLTERAAS
ncbi:ABC transporter ATP-binding protein [Streptomyces sp. NPDC048603]|uniref:ABC transporter ATP-binding protein n=1 Tax=Streptomyces sp. NPDC048603 TaxID=3365577 RepID=UPI0037207F1D